MLRSAADGMGVIWMRQTRRTRASRRDRSPYLGLCVAMGMLSLGLVACGEHPATSLGEAADGRDKWSMISEDADLATGGAGPEIDACVVALGESELDAEDPIDREIGRFRGQAAGASSEEVRSANLERLGWSLVAKARSTSDSGYYTLAERASSCILKTDPEHVGAKLLRGHVLNSEHRFAEAEVLAREIVAARGLSFDYGLLGDSLLEQGKLEGAVAAYQQMLDLKPSSAAYSRAADVRWQTGDLAGAIELMEKAAGAVGGADREAAAWARIRLGQFYFEAGRMERAQKQVDSALALEPEYPPALLLRGRILLLEEDGAGRASELLQRAASAVPLPGYLWVYLEALEEAGDVSRRGEVEAELRRSGALDDPRTYSLFLATRNSDLDVALNLAQRELRVRQDVFTLDALAWAAHRAGDSSEARRRIREALAVGTRDARIFLHAASIAEAAGADDEARQYLESADGVRRMLLPSELVLLRELATRLGRPLSMLNP